MASDISPSAAPSLTELSCPTSPSQVQKVEGQSGLFGAPQLATHQAASFSVPETPTQVNASKPVPASVVASASPAASSASLAALAPPAPRLAISASLFATSASLSAEPLPVKELSKGTSPSQAQTVEGQSGLSGAPQLATHQSVSFFVPETPLHV